MPTHESVQKKEAPSRAASRPALQRAPDEGAASLPGFGAELSRAPTQAQRRADLAHPQPPKAQGNAFTPSHSATPAIQRVRDGDKKGRRGLDPSDAQYLDPNSASSYKRFNGIDKNSEWEVVFRGIRKVKNFDPARGQAFAEWQSEGWGIEGAHTYGFAATSRDHNFAETVAMASGSGGASGAVVYAAVVPPGYGLDIQAYANKGADKTLNSYFKGNDAKSEAQRIKRAADQAQEISLLSQPEHLIIGWKSSYMDRASGKEVTTYTPNNAFALPNGIQLADITGYDRYQQWMSQFQQAPPQPQDGEILEQASNELQQELPDPSAQLQVADENNATPNEITQNETAL